MDKFQPIFLEDLRISIPGYTILRLAHHRHTLKSDLIEEHTHTHSQFLLYLRGQGVQILNYEPMPVRRGALLYFPPGTPHGFIKSLKSPPLSLVINFKENKAKNWKFKNGMKHCYFFSAYLEKYKLGIKTRKTISNTERKYKLLLSRITKKHIEKYDIKKSDVNINQIANFVFNGLVLINLLHRNKSSKASINSYKKSLYQFITNITLTGMNK